MQTEAEKFLSVRALDRRKRQNLAVSIQDFPVSQNYLRRLKEAGVYVYYTSRWKNCAIVQEEEATLAQFDFIDRIEYLARGERLTKTNDRNRRPTSFEVPPRVESSTDFQNELLGVDKMHDDEYLGENMLIAVFDDGYEGVNVYQPFAHLFTENQITETWNFVTNDENVFVFDDHGTKVLTGIAASYQGEENKISGTAPNADYMLFITEDIRSEFRIEEYNWLLAAEKADSAGADIINASLGYSTFTDRSMNYDPEDMDGETAVCTQAANIASSKGMIVVVSAGNEGGRSWRTLTAPADAKNILAVGSVNIELDRSTFSSFGPSADGRVKPDVSALGSLATIMLDAGVITTGNGTSFSSPQIAGLAAGVWQARPDWTNHQVMESIRLSSSRASTPNDELGYGIPNFRRAISDVKLSVEDIINDKIKVYPNPFQNNKIYVDLSSSVMKNDITVTMIDIKGTEIYRITLDRNNKPDELEITFDNVENGTYFLIIKSKKYNKSVKLIKF
ncbi:MAG: S8 family serine peptidase [Cyclobacteriaceae bacterium]